MSSIFSAYKGGENRVTSSILAVLRLLSLPVFDFIVSGLIDNDGDALISIIDQPSKNGAGIPDGQIQSSFNILIETKTTLTHNLTTDDKEQIIRHLNRLNGKTELDRLIYLTPDPVEPIGLNDFNNSNLVWKRFVDLYELLAILLDERPIRLSSDESFMLSHLLKMIEDENLMRTHNNVVVVAANRNAWATYTKFGTYICQPNRGFRQVEYIAFYANGHVQPKIAKIYDRIQETTLELIQNKHLKNTVSNALHYQGNTMDTFQVFRLSDQYSPDTIILDQAIPNDCVSRTTGNTVAYVQGLTYTSLDRLKILHQTTSGLKP